MSALENDTTPMKISIVTWDASFREHFHTIDYVAGIDYPADDFEFIWVEFYDKIHPEVHRRMEGPPNFRVALMEQQGSWHAGRCMNHGIEQARGELLAIIDGDVVLRPEFLRQAEAMHRAYPDAAIYVRRWDQREKDYRKDFDLDHLEATCEMENGLNFGGCIIASRKLFDALGGYETHEILAGAGLVSGELAIRIRNSGAPVIWHPTMKIYHPWHDGTLPRLDPKRKQQQQWVAKQRELNLDLKADANQIETYLKQLDRQNAAHTAEAAPAHTAAPGALSHFVRLKRRIFGQPGS